MKTFVIGLLAALVCLAACKKPVEETASNSRLVRYEVSGNFTGTLFASYTTSTGSTTNDPIAALQWSKDITYANNVTAAIIAVSGNGGTAGQQVTIVVKRGGSQVSSTQATANSSGSFTQATPVVTF